MRGSPARTRRPGRRGPALETLRIPLRTRPRAGTRANLGRWHEFKTGRRRFWRRAGAAPFIVLALDFAGRLTIADRRHAGGRWHAQDGPPAQPVDVARESLRVRPVERDHHLVQGGIAGPAEPLGNPPQRFVRPDGAIHVAVRPGGDLSLGLGLGLGLGRGRRRRSRCSGRVPADGRRDLCGTCGHRCRGGGCRTGLPGSKGRRIEQHGVLAEQPALPPAHVDQQGHEGLADGLAGGHADHGPGTLPADVEAEAIEESGAVEAEALKGGGRRQLHGELGEFLGGLAGNGDLGQEGLVQRGPQLDLAESQRTSGQR